MPTITSDDGHSSMVVTGQPKHASFAAALAAFQAELPKIRKDETAKVTGESKSGAKVSYTYGYAGLDTVVDTVLPVLGKHGLSITSKSTFADGNFMLEVSLLHESGERETGHWPLPDPRRVGPQDLGSAYTYGRRYLTLALTGTFPGGEDDDGAKAQSSARNSWDDARPAKRQEEPTPPQKTSWTDEEVYAYQEKMALSELDLAVKGYDWMASKDLHNRKVTGGAYSTDLRSATEMLAERLAEEAIAPDIELAAIEGLKAIAADRGLLKVQVSATETLDQVIYEAHELAKHAADQGNPAPGGE
jgi:hypothetical protein